MNSPSVCCDTSFLFALYCTNEHTPKALRRLRSLGKPILLSTIIDYELANALRLSEYREPIAPGRSELHLSEYEEDYRAGRLVHAAINLDAVFAAAKRLSQKYVLSAGSRSFDMLHVATALVLQAGLFLTFDRQQQRLAIAEGLKSPR